MPRKGGKHPQGARRPEAGGKRSAQPGTGDGVRIEARRGETRQLHRRGSMRSTIDGPEGQRKETTKHKMYCAGSDDRHNS